MLGAIVGDIVGSVYEFNPIRTTRFPLFGQGNHFTDDTVLTMAVADALLRRRSYAKTFREYYERYPLAGYGTRFRQWARSWNNQPKDSMGNGAAMRVSPVGWAGATLDQALREARRSALPTHRHPEGIKGAQAVAAAIFLARQGASKRRIKAYVARTFGYKLGLPLHAWRQRRRLNGTCPGSVPPALTAFLESTDYEDAIRKAVALGCDSDTLACIAGAVAEAYYGGVPPAIAQQALDLLPAEFLKVLARFHQRYVLPLPSTFAW